MKQVIVLRHAPKDKSGNLTQEGIEYAKKFHGKLGNLDMILSSDVLRAQKTTELLTGKTPKIDKRASIPAFTLLQEEELFELGKKHPLGIAGVIFDTPEYIELAKVRGETLVDLIKETLRKLPENGKALIVSHDAVMVIADKLLQNKPLTNAEKNYKPLEGFTVDENLKFSYFSIEEK